MNASQRGYDWRWRRFAKGYLAEQSHQFCQIQTHCAGAFATEVDHVVPLRDAPERKYDRRNLQPACHPCHSAKTASGR